MWILKPMTRLSGALRSNGERNARELQASMHIPENGGDFVPYCENGLVIPLGYGYCQDGFIEQFSTTIADIKGIHDKLGGIEETIYKMNYESVQRRVAAFFVGVK